MKTLALLQNTWVRDPARAKQTLARCIQIKGCHFAGRAHFVGSLLFMGSPTGKRLDALLGDHCNRIIFEEACTEILDNPRDVPPIDYEHVRKVLRHHQPELVITFGRVAEKAYLEVSRMGDIIPVPRHIHSPHPTSRGDAQSDLRVAMGAVRILLEQPKPTT